MFESSAARRASLDVGDIVKTLSRINKPRRLALPADLYCQSEITSPDAEFDKISLRFEADKQENAPDSESMDESQAADSISLTTSESSFTSIDSSDQVTLCNLFARSGIPLKEMVL